MKVSAAWNRASIEFSVGGRARKMSLRRSRPSGWRRLSKPALLWVGLPILAIPAIVLPFVFLGVGSPADIVAFHRMSKGGFHPIWKDLALRRIKKGDTVESVVKIHPPLIREDYPPYTRLYYGRSGTFDRLAVFAKEGRLFFAIAGSHGQEHRFFGSSAEETLAYEEHWAYTMQRFFEQKAYRVHLAITHSQDVFRARVVNRTDIPFPSMYDGGDLAPKYTRWELTIKVTEVLRGDLALGAMLKFKDESCRGVYPGAPDLVLLRFEDGQLVIPGYERGELYIGVSQETYDWYCSLTAEEVQQFEARVKAFEPIFLARRRELII